MPHVHVAAREAAGRVHRATKEMVMMVVMYIKNADVLQGFSFSSHRPEKRDPSCSHVRIAPKKKERSFRWLADCSITISLVYMSGCFRDVVR